MTPIHYWLAQPPELLVADFLNSSNFMFWHPGPDKFLRTAPPKGWRKHIHTRKPAYALLPYASHDPISLPGVARFIRYRVKSLPRSGGELLVTLKVHHPKIVSIALAHYRHRGPSSPLRDFPTRDKLPDNLQRWLPRSF